MVHRHIVPAALLILVGITVASGAAPAAREAPCVRLENRIADLRLKLRLGYSAKQGRIYRQRLAALEDQRRRECR